MYTLPEITIEGRAGSDPENSAIGSPTDSYSAGTNPILHLRHQRRCKRNY